MYKKFSLNRFEPGSQNFGRARTENWNQQPNPELRTEQDRTFGPVRWFSVHWISSEQNFGNPIWELPLTEVTVLIAHVVECSRAAHPLIAAGG